MTTIGSLEARVRDLEAENARLHERLEDSHAFVVDETVPDGMRRVEVEPGSIPDGIECRDATIAGLEAENARLRDDIDGAEDALDDVFRFIDILMETATPTPSQEAEILAMRNKMVAEMALDEALARAAIKTEVE